MRLHVAVPPPASPPAPLSVPPPSPQPSSSTFMSMVAPRIFPAAGPLPPSPPLPPAYFLASLAFIFCFPLRPRLPPRGFQPLLIPQTLASPCSALRLPPWPASPRARLLCGPVRGCACITNGISMGSQAFCVTSTAERGPWCPGPPGGASPVLEGDRVGLGLGLGQEASAAPGSPGWLWCQPTCHGGVPTSRNRDGPAASERQWRLVLSPPPYTPQPGLQRAGTVFMPLGSLSSSGSQQGRRGAGGRQPQLFMERLFVPGSAAGPGCRVGNESPLSSASWGSQAQLNQSKLVLRAAHVSPPVAVRARPEPSRVA